MSMNEKQSEGAYVCLFPGCENTNYDPEMLRLHYLYEHYNDCLYPGCWLRFHDLTDLRRHIRKHREGPRAFNCPAPGCPRKGENGFYRKDKMKDHYKNKHTGVQFTL